MPEIYCKVVGGPRDGEHVSLKHLPKMIKLADPVSELEILSEPMSTSDVVCTWSWYERKDFAFSGKFYGDDREWSEYHYKESVK